MNKMTAVISKDTNTILGLFRDEANAIEAFDRFMEWDWRSETFFLPADAPIYITEIVTDL
jgi:hypothetical protein